MAHCLRSSTFQRYVAVEREQMLDYTYFASTDSKSAAYLTIERFPKGEIRKPQSALSRGAEISPEIVQLQQQN